MRRHSPASSDPDICDPADAIPAAAAYLESNGAPGDWTRALYRYNPADWYPPLVLRWAARYGYGAAVVWPLDGRITQVFGPTTFTAEPARCYAGTCYAHFHDGLDIAAALGTPVRAIAAGRVVLAGRVADGAVVVEIDHGAGVLSTYGHLEVDLGRRGGRVGRRGRGDRAGGPDRQHDRAAPAPRDLERGACRWTPSACCRRARDPRPRTDRCAGSCRSRPWWPRRSGSCSPLPSSPASCPSPASAPTTARRRRRRSGSSSPCRRGSTPTRASRSSSSGASIPARGAASTPGASAGPRLSSGSSARGGALAWEIETNRQMAALVETSLRTLYPGVAIETTDAPDRPPAAVAIGRLTGSAGWPLREVAAPEARVLRALAAALEHAPTDAEVRLRLIARPVPPDAWHREVAPPDEAGSTSGSSLIGRAVIDAILLRPTAATGSREPVRRSPAEREAANRKRRGVVGFDVGLRLEVAGVTADAAEALLWRLVHFTAELDDGRQAIRWEIRRGAGGTAPPARLADWELAQLWYLPDGSFDRAGFARARPLGAAPPSEHGSLGLVARARAAAARSPCPPTPSPAISRSSARPDPARARSCSTSSSRSRSRRSGRRSSIPTAI